MSADRARDRSFLEFLRAQKGIGPRARQTRRLARAFIEGFDAAPADRIG